MLTRYRLISLILAATLLALVGCSGSAIAGPKEVSVIEETTLVRQLQYVDGQTEGPMYNLSVTVPEEWVGQFETNIRGNRMTFEFIVEHDDDEDVEADLENEEDTRIRASVFFVEALSSGQYWEQVGSYPGDYYNLKFTADTYFIYHLPIDSYYSGLSDEEYAAFAAEIPGIAQSFIVERAG